MGSRHLLKSICQCIDGLHVEMVGGLVQQQDVGLRQGDGGEDDTRFLSAGQLADGLQMVMPAQAKAPQLCSHLLRLQAGLQLQANLVMSASTCLDSRFFQSCKASPSVSCIPSLLHCGTQKIEELKMYAALSH